MYLYSGDRIMGIIRPKIGSLATIFEFASGAPAFELVDITSTPSKNSDNFLYAPGDFVYRSTVLVNQNNAAALGVDGLVFKFYNVDPRRYRVTPANEITEHSVRFETSDRKMKRLGTHASKGVYIDSFESATKNIFVAADKAGMTNVDKVYVPPAFPPQAIAAAAILSNNMLDKRKDPASQVGLGSKPYQPIESAHCAGSSNNSESGGYSHVNVLGKKSFGKSNSLWALGKLV